MLELVAVLVLDVDIELVCVCVTTCVLEFLTDALYDVDEEGVLDGRIDTVAVVDFVDVFEELVDPEFVGDEVIVLDALGVAVSVLVGIIVTDLKGLELGVFDIIDEKDKTADIVPLLDAVVVRVLVLEGAVVIEDLVEGVTIFVGLIETLGADVRVELLLGRVDCVGIIPTSLRCLILFTTLVLLYAVNTFNNRIKRRGLLILLYRIVFLP